MRADHAWSDTLKRALAAHRAGNFTEAERNYRAILRLEPNHFDALHLLGLMEAQRKGYEEAERLIGRALAIKPTSVEALYNRGKVLRALKRPEAALASYDRVLAIQPSHAGALNHRGNVLQQLKRHEEALASYDQALAIKPDHVELLGNRGDVLQKLERQGEALTSYDQALAIKPGYFEVLNNRGAVLEQLNRCEEALTSYDQALAIKPDHVVVLNNRGNVLQKLERQEEALTSYDQALAIKPDHVEVLNNRGNVLRRLRRLEEALTSYDKALALKPEHIHALNNSGVVLDELNRWDEALKRYDQALAIKPNEAEALYKRGIVLLKLKRHDEALMSYHHALEAKPDHPYAFSALARSALHACDWTLTAKLADKLVAHVMDRTAIVDPFTLFGYRHDPLLQLECAKSFALHTIPVLPQPLYTGTIWRHDKIRIAYLSSDFRKHATAILMVGLIELHSRSRFEVLGISLGPDDGSDMRSRLAKAFDQFHDVRRVGDREVAKLLNEIQVDIAIDLNGYTTGCRPGILAHRPAPIQVNYLGFPGTMGVDFIDYVIADRIVLPLDQQPYYTEKIVHLPDCFQVNDSSRRIAVRAPTRQEVGLPDQGFVFCCFNNNWKITSSVFDVWMRLLRSVKGSVLWLLRDNEVALRHLRKEASARGVDPARLVFAGIINHDLHLARHRLADLFLDTLPVNAGTTASDALWAGLPVLTCRSGRIASSLLHAVGLADMVTNNLQDYEALALRLAGDPSHLRAIRRKLEQNRKSYPLFDTERFRDHIEAAYMQMWELWQCGESPRTFSVNCKNLQRVPI
jgi:protein O-GlcNAc transferase